MKSLLILSVLLVGAFCITNTRLQYARDIFQHWKIAHNKAYKAGHEEEHRFNIFLGNYALILKHNQEKSDVTLGLNQFADLTDQEFADLYTGLLPSKNNNNRKAFTSQLSALPDKVDWRSKGAVTPVKNQLACGSCWAFSASGALEGLYFIDKGQLESFSEQNLVDCVALESMGCLGGFMQDAFEYTAEYGIERGADYPYVAKDQDCNYKESKAIHVNGDWDWIEMKNVTALKAAIVAQPISVAIRADQNVFRFYRSGVITTGCGAELNHGVLAIGYDKFNGIEAFVVKNSWGTIWGNNGYVLIGTDPTQNGGFGVCGILRDACFPTLH